VVTGFYLLLAPAGTPRAIVTRLNAEAAKALETPAVRTRLAELGAHPVGNSPEACADLIKSEIAKWAPVVKASGAAAD
jgi:tripartite-type tricarboxylate transporter receptor subunit TctC